LIASALVFIEFNYYGERSSTQIISVEPGKNTDVHFAINLAGKVYRVPVAYGNAISTSR